jgi:hypothetical protein
MLHVILELFVVIIVSLIIIGIVLAAKMMEIDYKKKTRRYTDYDGNKAGHIANAKKSDFQSYRDNDKEYQSALAQLGQIQQHRESDHGDTKGDKN